MTTILQRAAVRALAVLPLLLPVLASRVSAATVRVAEVAPAVLPTVRGEDLAAAARALAVGGEELRVSGLLDADSLRRLDAVVRRVEVFTSDAEIVVMRADGPQRRRPPRNAYLSGAVEGLPGSSVVLTVRPDGTVRGLVAEEAGIAVVGSSADGRLELRRASLATTDASPFVCDGGLSPPAAARARTPVPPAAPGSISGVGGARAAAAGIPTHLARVAIETDHEYYLKFDDEEEAASYAAELIAFASLRYASEVGTALAIPYLRLWTTDADPYAQTGSLCALMELGQVWNTTQTGVARTLVHMLSGKSGMAGTGWIGALCGSPFTYGATCPGVTAGQWGGDYSRVGGISGTFDPAVGTIGWDSVAVAHEIGHNFNSPHTHCYNGLGGNASPVDACYNGQAGQGCWAASTSLPGVGALSGGSGGSRNGTIMSYCHLLGGGMGNLSFTLGTGHAYGVAPGRVPERMASYVAEIAADDPVCLALPVLLVDGFESGTLAAWE